MAKLFLKTALIISMIMALGAGMTACPQGTVTTGKDGQKRAELQKRMERLDIRYQVLQKDSPPQNDTLVFRRDLSSAQKAIEESDLNMAERHITEAEAWMDNARPRYYQSHKSRIVSGQGEESPDELMEEAEFYLSRARSEDAAGNDWEAELFYQAAIEQGRLAITAAQGDPEKALMLVDLAKRMEKIYIAAGQPEKAEDLKSEVSKSLQASIDKLGARIEDRMAGRATGYDLDTLVRKEGAFSLAKQDLNRLNSLRNAIIEQAREYAPGKIEANSYTRKISNWIGKKTTDISNYGKIEPKPADGPAHDREAILKLELAEHNSQYRVGAQSLRGTGLSLKETDIYIREDGSLVVRGELQNFRTEPIYNPKVTIVGQVYADVVDLGYNRFDPLIATSFHIPILGFNADAMERSGMIPPHELVLIFYEDNGIQRKVITRTIR